MAERGEASVRGWQSVDRRSSLAALDAAVEYLRERPGRVLGPYVLATAPLSLTMLLLIDAISVGQRSGVWLWTLVLVAAMVWRWIGLAAVQRRVQNDLRGQPPLALGPRLPAIIVLRMASALAITWGSFVIIPSFYGLIYAGIATPLLLEQDDSLSRRLGALMQWIGGEMPRLSKLFVSLGVIVFVVICGLLTLQVMLVGAPEGEMGVRRVITGGVSILPSILGMSASDLAVTIRSTAWLLAAGYLFFLVLDLYWTVASVMLFYDLQARKLGTDLRVRIGQLSRTPGAGAGATGARA